MRWNLKLEGTHKMAHSAGAIVGVGWGMGAGGNRRRR